AAAHRRRAVLERELVDLRPRRAVEAPRAQGGEHPTLPALRASRPDRGAPAVAAGVGRDARPNPVHTAALRVRLVTVQPTRAAPALEPAAGVVALDLGEPVAGLELPGPQAAPVRVREVRDAPLREDPLDHLGQPRELALGKLRVALDPEGEDVRVVL